MSLRNSGKSRIPHLQLHKRAINQSPSRLVDSRNKHIPLPGARADHTYKSISGREVSDILPEPVRTQGGTKMAPIEPEASPTPNLGSQFQAVKATLREKPILHISLVGDDTDQGDIARVTECLSGAVDISSVQEMSLYFVRTTCGTVRIARPDGANFKKFNNAILSTGYELVDSYTVGSVLYILIQKKCSDQPMGVGQKITLPDESSLTRHEIDTRLSSQGMTKDGATNKAEYILPQNTHGPEIQANPSKPFSAHTLCNCDVVDSPHYRNHPSLAAFPILADQNVMENSHGDRDIPFRGCFSTQEQTLTSMYVRGGDHCDSVIIDGLKKDITHTALVSKLLISARQADLDRANSHGGSKLDSTVEVVGGLPQGRKTSGSKILEIPPRCSSIGFQQKQLLKRPGDLPEKPRTSTEHTIVQQSSSPLVVSVSANKLEKDDSLTRHTYQPEPSSTIRPDERVMLSSEERTCRFREIFEYHWQPQKKQETRTSLYSRESYASTLSVATHRTAESISQPSHIDIRSAPVPERTTVATPRNYQATSCNTSDPSFGVLRRSPLSKFDEIIAKHWPERQSSTPLNISQPTPFHMDQIITDTKVKEDPPIMSDIRPVSKEKGQNFRASNGKAGFPSTFRRSRALRASSDSSKLPALPESHDETSYPFTSTTSKTPTIVPEAATLVVSAKTKVANPLRRTRRESSYNITTVNGGNWLDVIPEDSLSSARASGVQLDPGFGISNLTAQSRSDPIIELYQKMNTPSAGGDTQYSSVNEDNRQPQTTENVATRKTAAKSGKGGVWLRELLYKTGLKNLKK